MNAENEEKRHKGSVLNPQHHTQTLICWSVPRPASYYDDPHLGVHDRRGHREEPELLLLTDGRFLCFIFQKYKRK